MDVFQSSRPYRHSRPILKEELVNGYKNFNKIVCKIVFHFLLNFTHITQDLYLSSIPML